MTTQKKRKRRTKAEIEDLFFESTKELVELIGFSNLTVTKIVQHANVESAVYYNRYTDLENFLDKFVREYDYWVSDKIIIDPKKKPLDNYKKIAENLIDCFWENKIMQKLISWELNDLNYITLRTAKNRDANSQHLIKYFSDKFKDLNINVITAILIGGIYYITMHKNIAAFNNIDFSTNEGFELLKKNILIIIDKVFGNINDLDSESHNNDNKKVKNVKINIAAELIKKQVSYEIIKESTKISDKELKALYEIKENNATNDSITIKDDDCSNDSLKRKRGRPRKNA